MEQNETQPVQARIKPLERRLYIPYLIMVAVILFQVGSAVWQPTPTQANNEIVNSENNIVKTRGIIDFKLSQCKFFTLIKAKLAESATLLPY